MIKTYILFFAAALLLSACSTVLPPMNQATAVKAADYSPKLPKKKRYNDTMLILTFSGGGTRAAALSYGVLKGLRDTMVKTQNGKTSLLSEVDMISAVSGGSFTAAYYGLFGERIFEDFEQRMLKKPIQSELLGGWLFNPENWGRLSGSQYNRTDLAADYYDKVIFEDKTFADMRPDMPFIIINTTDIGAGTAFAFTPTDFRWICSDLDYYPVSRAVAASSAVPGLFSPIALKNHGGCKPFRYQNRNVRAQHRRDEQALSVRKYQDKQRYPYLHLVDGGVSDNLGVRAFLNVAAAQNDNFLNLMRTYGLSGVKKVAFIVVNSSDDIPPRIAQNAGEPKVEDTIGAVTTLQSRRYNTDTLDLLTEQTKKWKAQVRRQQCGKSPKKSCQPIQFYVIELNLKQLPKILADEASLYPTTLELPEKQVDTLIYAGQYLLNHSPPFSRLLRDLRKH